MPITEADLGNLLTVDATAEILGVSRSTVKRMIHRHELDVVRVGSGRGMPRITRRSLLDNLNRRETRAAKSA